MSNICEKHGVLKRSCHICELEEENKELKSLSLWALRRVHRSQKEFGYDEYKKVTGEEPERL